MVSKNIGGNIRVNSENNVTADSICLKYNMYSFHKYVFDTILDQPPQL